MPSVAVEIENRFASLLRGGRNPGALESSHAMLWSYFDDSSDDKRRRYFAVGGLIAGESHWNGCSFHLDWALATKNLKEPFRSTDCETQQGQFKNWAKADCDNLIAKLVTILVENQLHSFASVVPVDLYREIFPQSDEYDAYYLAVIHAIVGLSGVARMHHNALGFGGMECWFEDSDATTGRTREIYKALKQLKSWPDAELLMPTPNFKDKALWTLQAADLVAREAFKHFDNLGKRDTRIPVKRMLKLINFARWNRETLEFVRDNGGPQNLELLTSWNSDPSRPLFDIVCAAT